MTELYYGDLKIGESTNGEYIFEERKIELQVSSSKKRNCISALLSCEDKVIADFYIVNKYDLKNVNSFLEKYGFVIKESRDKWRAKGREKYYYINGIGNILESREEFDNTDTMRYRVLNYFKTREEAFDSPIYKSYKRVLDINFELNFA